MAIQYKGLWYHVQMCFLCKDIARISAPAKKCHINNVPWMPHVSGPSPYWHLNYTHLQSRLRDHFLHLAGSSTGFSFTLMLGQQTLQIFHITNGHLHVFPLFFFFLFRLGLLSQLFLFKRNTKTLHPQRRPWTTHIRYYFLFKNRKLSVHYQCQLTNERNVFYAPSRSLA